jgi:DNA-binding NtrC family response regulator
VVGKGSHFKLYLPARPPTETPRVDTLPERLVRGNGQNILLVEDEATTRQALTEGLTLINYKVTPFSNGKEALEYLREQSERVDLVLSDVVMPEMGGMALLSSMRSDGMRTPVIFMTGHPLPADTPGTQEKPLIWLQKPPRLQQLAYVLARALH